MILIIPFKNPSGTDNQNLSGCFQAVYEYINILAHNQMRIKDLLSGMLDILTGQLS